MCPTPPLNLEQVRSARAARRQAGRDADLVAGFREAGLHGGVGAAFDSASVSSGSSLCWASTPQSRLAAAHHLLVRRQRQHRRARPVGRDQGGGVARIGRRDDAGQAELVHRAHGPERDRVVLVVGLRAALREPAAVGQLALGRLGYRGHHLNGQHRVAANGRLLGEHHGIGAVEDRVGHVGDLGARGAGRVDHRLEHLGGRDRRLGPPARECEQPLLDERHLLDRQLDPEVAAGDHDAVRRVDDLLAVGGRLRLLDLRYQRHLRAALARCSRTGSRSSRRRTNESAKKSSAHLERRRRSARCPRR